MQASSSATASSSSADDLSTRGASSRAIRRVSAQQRGVGDAALGAVDHRVPVDRLAAQPVLQLAERTAPAGSVSTRSIRASAS